MSTSRQTAGRRAVVSLVLFAGVFLPQALFSQVAYPHSNGMPPISNPGWGPFIFGSPWNYPAPRMTKEPMISADFLRHPISGKAQRALLKAEKRGDAGDHRGALTELRDALAKFPKAAPYVYNLRGVEYVQLKDFAAAREEFKAVLTIMPHISANHSNYGLTLAALGQDGQARQELRTALVLDMTNQSAKMFLDALNQEDGK